MRSPWLWLEAFLYVSFALLGVSAAVLQPGEVVGDGVDLYGTLWFYWWIQDCILAWRDPGFTDLFFHPLGKDIFAHTGNNFLDAVLAAPFFWVFGPRLYQPIFVFALMLANTLSFRLLARALFQQRVAVLAATLAWELNPYVLFEITCGRLTQATLIFVPLALLGWLRCEESGRASWWGAGLLGVSAALQAWTYWFMGWFLVFFMTPLAAWAIWQSQHRRRLLLRYAAAAAICLLLVTPAGLSMVALSESGSVPGLIEAPVSLLEPPPKVQNNISSSLYGLLIVERFGVPLFSQWAVMATLALWWMLGRDRGRWTLALLVGLSFGLGPLLTNDPRSDQGLVMPHYMAAYHYLPFFKRLWFPYRISSILMIVPCLALGQLLARDWGRAQSMRCVGLGTYLALSLGESHRFATYPFPSQDIGPPEIVEIIREEGGGVIDMPFGIYSTSVVWQTFHEQPLFGGMGENAPLLWPEGMKRQLRNSFVSALIKACRHPERPADYKAPQRASLEAQGYRWVLLHRELIVSRKEKTPPGKIQPADRFVELLGPPAAIEGPLWLWDLKGEASVPEALKPTEERMAAPVLVEDPRPAYEIALEEEGRMAAPPKERAPRGKSRR